MARLPSWFDTLNKSAELVVGFVNTEYAKNSVTALLRVGAEPRGERVKMLVAAGFDSGAVYVSDLPHQMNDEINLACYRRRLLYLGPQNTGGRAPWTRFYAAAPYYDFRSVNWLQTLPADKPIILYSSNGFESACMTGHLRVLGYNAKSFLFGANQLFHYRLITTDELKGDAFSAMDVINYPFATGD